MNLPEIRIKNSSLLNNKVIPMLMPGLKESGHEYVASDEYINDKVEAYNQAWVTHGEVILQSICEVLDVKFNQNIIDAYVVPFGNSFSDPMIISTKYTPERFLEVFTHELTHRLLTDNTKLTKKGDRKLSSYWKELFGDTHSFVTLVHIPVHAILEYVFTDILGEPQRLQRDKEACMRFPDYHLAWQYVELNGYKGILEQLREQYNSFETPD
jgi:hypothetical protein